MVRAEELKPADELQCWLKLGLYLRKFTTATGVTYWNIVHAKAPATPHDIIRFKAWVISNDSENRILNLNIAEMDGVQGTIGGNYQAEISYTAFRELRRYSKISFPGKPISPKRPTRKALGAGNYPYRTVEEVIL